MALNYYCMQCGSLQANTEALSRFPIEIEKIIEVLLCIRERGLCLGKRDLALTKRDMIYQRKRPMPRYLVRERDLCFGKRDLALSSLEERHDISAKEAYVSVPCF